ncbi:hypothetical protein AcV5_005434 [Taiwanofungus camphoratus]|nr:hypothetical protein AcV5_005434 [Antrodia cinnamomea]
MRRHGVAPLLSQGRKVIPQPQDRGQIRSARRSPLDTPTTQDVTARTQVRNLGSPIACQLSWDSESDPVTVMSLGIDFCESGMFDKCVWTCELEMSNTHSFRGTCGLMGGQEDGARWAAQPDGGIRVGEVEGDDVTPPAREMDAALLEVDTRREGRV